jgi:hypothetical protein
MKKIWYALILAGLTGASAELRAGGWGHYHGHPGRSHFGIGFHFGAPFGYRYYPYYRYPAYSFHPYHPYYPYPPAVITVPSQPPVYIEKELDRSSSGRPGGYWYYCTDPPGYYPYVKECGEEWQPVPAQPPTKP